MSRTVLILSSSWPPFVGGAQNYLYQIYRRLNDLEIVVFTIQHPRSIDFDVQQRWRTFRISRESFYACWNGGRRQRLALLGELNRIIQDTDIDLVITGFTFPDGLIALMLKNIYRIPYIVHFYGSDFLEPMEYSPWEKSKIMEIFKESDQLIGCSTYSSDKVIETGVKPGKVHTVLPGVDSHRFHPVDIDSKREIRQKLGLPDEKIMLTVSRLVPRKGHDNVIKSLPYVLEKYPNLRYLIVGEGENRQNLQAIVDENDLSNRVEFVGLINDTQLPLYYQASDLFIMPNREIDGDVEGFGIVFLEASACGIPVIGGKSGGAKDATEIGNSGYLVDPYKITQISDIIIELFSDDARLTLLGKSGRRMVEERFSWDLSAKQVQKIIDNTSAYRKSFTSNYFIRGIKSVKEIARNNLLGASLMGNIKQYLTDKIPDRFHSFVQ